MTFDKPVKKLRVWNGKNSNCNGNICTFTNKNYNKVKHEGSILSLGYQARFKQKPTGEVLGLKFNGIDVCGDATTSSTSTTTSTTSSSTTTTQG